MTAISVESSYIRSKIESFSHLLFSKNQWLVSDGSNVASFSALAWYGLILLAGTVD